MRKGFMIKKTVALLAATGIIFSAYPTGVYAEAGDTAQTSEVQETGAKADAKTDAASLEDNLVTTKHEVTIRGKKIPYTAEAGTVILESGGYTCEMFYTAYTRDDVENLKERPITFAFNGGPGASSYCIQFGCMGP
nr:hypothetical protein [Lachnospiraceae bacterium]